MFKAMLIAGAGGFIGTCLRYLVGKLAHYVFSSPFPWGTFAVNIIGSFVPSAAGSEDFREYLPEKTEDLLPDKNIHFCHRSGNPHKFPLRYVHHPQGSDDMEKARKVHTSDGLSGTPYSRKH